MTRYEYKVLPAPSKGRKASGVKTPEGRFALGLEHTMNTLGAEGWEYQRSDLLPSEERQGLTSSHTVYRSVLVFRRVLDEATTPAPVPAAAHETAPAPKLGPAAAPGSKAAAPAPAASRGRTEGAAPAIPARIPPD